MKLLIPLVLMLIVSNVFAKGHDCEALCIVLDSQDSTVYYLDQINIVAGTTRKETLHLLKNKCKQLASHHGFRYGSLLVDSLEYRSSRVDESEDSYSSSNSDSRSVEGWAREGVSAGAVRGRGRTGAIYASYNLEGGVGASSSSSSSSSSYHRNNRQRQLDIRLLPSLPETSCVEDDDIATGNIPYTGGIVIN